MNAEERHVGIDEKIAEKSRAKALSFTGFPPCVIKIFLEIERRGCLRRDAGANILLSFTVAVVADDFSNRFVSIDPTGGAIPRRKDLESVTTVQPAQYTTTADSPPVRDDEVREIRRGSSSRRTARAVVDFARPIIQGE